MRLLFFAQSFLPVVGGAEVFLDGLARRLTERGHGVTVIAARKRGLENELDVPYRVLRYTKPFYRRAWPSYGSMHLLRAHLAEPPDCVHAHGTYPPGYAVAAYARIAKRPWVVRPIGFDILPDETFRKNPVLEARIARTLQAATRVVAQSVELVELVRELGVPDERIVRIPNAVDACDAPPAARELASVPTIAAMGIFHPKKGFDVLLRAFARVRERVSGARLVLAGDGEERAALARLVDELGLGASVELPGMLSGDAKAAFLRSAWVFVSSARREPFSNANLEALGAGLPLVVTAVGGNREIVAERENGLLVPPDDEEALAGAIVELLGDAAARERFGRASLVRAKEYSWSSIVDRYEALYADLADGARR
ncbi:MAG: glycosyltransferase family 4 protein [Planctomycetes bacterium]|nr:glycosyltransferase family 4 protein [Planctomycetota bacterium]